MKDRTRKMEVCDQEIVDLYWQRDQEAVAATERVYGVRLRNLAKNILHSQQDAEECVNDTYLKAWQTIPPTKPQCLFAYLMKICRFKAFDRLDWQNAQKRKGQVIQLTAELTECIPDAAIEKNLEGQEIGCLLDTFVRRLSEDKRRMFLRRYWLGQSIAEIAREIGRGESYVKTNLYRIRESLRSYLEEEGVLI